MVSIKHKFDYLENGEIDIESWLHKVKHTYRLENTDMIKSACLLANDACKGLTTFYGQACIEKSLEMAEIMLNLKLDNEAVVTAIMLSSTQQTKLTLETIESKLSPAIAKLLRGIQQMEAIYQLQKNGTKVRDQTQIDRLRKLLLAMVSDIRVVLIKLAERTCMMRGIKGINPQERKHFAQETMDIYAPLANRLGIGQLKWELEDIAFHYTDPDTYKKIAKFLSESRADRELRIHTTITKIKHSLAQMHIEADVSGRAKHIYSIYSKIKRKSADFEHIYDYSAIRILVPSIQDCYAALSTVHSLWEQIPAEFDDYIATPKPNGYRSIHTAVIGPDGKNLEIQIRTQAMHEEAERGVAAHWVYKENKSPSSHYESKIAFLRQLIDWHKGLTNDDEGMSPAYDQILSDRVYVFTPEGEILDLPTGATPLDFAYHIHSAVGDHCRGAKINGHIVPLTYTLRTGDRIEIMTNPNGTPSRDWLNPEFGFIKTPRAKAKISHWFRQLDLTQHIEHGRRILEREFPRSTPQLNLQKLASRFECKDEDTFLAALGRGNIRVAQITRAMEEEHQPTKQAVIHLTTKKPESTHKTMNIAGVSDLLTRVARCCKPIPGDAIIGFITQGRGVSIHKQTCNNISHLNPLENNRLLAVSWDSKHAGTYYVDVQIRAHSRENFLKEVTTVLANDKINIVNLNSTVSRNNVLIVNLTVQINALTQLKAVLVQINHLQGVISAQRMSD